MYIRAHRNPPSDVYSLNGGSTYPISNLYMHLRMYDFVMFTCIGYDLPTFWEYMSIWGGFCAPFGRRIEECTHLMFESSDDLMIEKSDDRSNWWLKHLMLDKYHLMVGKKNLMIEKHLKKYLMIIRSDDWSIWWLISKSDDWSIWLLKHLTIEASDYWSIWWMKHLTIVTMTIEA